MESSPGRGTTFIIDFPSASIEAVASVVPPAAVHAAAGTGTETILVVEDQRELRDVVGQMLRRHGYTVIEAGDGQAALALLQTHAAPVQLLLTDVIMPQMSGRQLADIITRDHRSIRILYMSGYTDDAIVRHGILNPGIAFIHKPFMPDQLLARVREVLDRPAPDSDLGQPR
ncbi:MAG: response regulator [Acidobacteriota bacterium]